MDERARGQTPGSHISTVSKCLWQLCVSSSPDAAFPVNCTNLGPPSLTCMVAVYCPLKLYHLSLAALQCCCGNLLFRNTHTL